MVEKQRCGWVGSEDCYIEYHDLEWGVPVRDDRLLFEMLTLEGAQAGLSWITVLRKREGYRGAFHGFSMERVASMSDGDLEHLMSDEGLIRNKRKIFSVRENARAALEIVKCEGELASFLWSFVDDRPIVNAWPSLADVPAQTDRSVNMSKALKKAGFRFVGPTICYAFMQGVGMVNDHITGCFRHSECAALA
jgi:DNA-3-methyladenine glycosylase I